MDLPPLICSFDLEDHRPPGEPWPERFSAPTRRLLDWFDERAITATVFVVGEVASANPGLVRDIASRGHELALHGWRHVPVTELTPGQFRSDVRRGKGVLEDLTGAEVLGFRAPTASMVRRTWRATEVLADEGYSYSSSVLPARNPLFGFDGAPSRPFRWPCGLAEFPIHVAGIGRWKVPITAGTYLRVVPWPVLEFLRRRQPWAAGNCTYFHPYDLDPDEPFHWLDDAGWMSPLVWVGRRAMLDRLGRLFADGAAPPYREQLALADDGGVFDVDGAAAAA